MLKVVVAPPPRLQALDAVRDGERSLQLRHAHHFSLDSSQLGRSGSCGRLPLSLHPP